MKHTPGPWKCGPQSLMIFADKNYGINIANIPHRGWDSDKPNALLIAAAPDLLAACKAILSATDFNPSEPLSMEQNRKIAEAQRMLQEAISKAEGEE